MYEGKDKQRLKYLGELQGQSRTVRHIPPRSCTSCQCQSDGADGIAENRLKRKRSTLPRPRSRWTLSIGSGSAAAGVGDDGTDGSDESDGGGRDPWLRAVQESQSSRDSSPSSEMAWQRRQPPAPKCSSVRRRLEKTLKFIIYFEIIF